MRVVDYLLKENAISDRQIQEAQQKRNGGTRSLLQAFLDLNIVDEKQVIQAFQESSEVPFVDLTSTNIAPEARQLIPDFLMKRYCAVPIACSEHGVLRVAMEDPSSLIAIDDLSEVSSMRVEPVLAARSQILSAIGEGNQSEQDVNSVLDDVIEFVHAKISLDEEMLNQDSSILKIDQSPIVKLVNTILLGGLKDGASDIHVEPLEQDIEVRYRVDGRLSVKVKVPKKVHKHLVSRLKIMADLDISECRRPQDGRIKDVICKHKINLRVSILPTVFGEKVVMRIMNGAQMHTNLEDAGLPGEDFYCLKKMIHQPQGIILVCGPTGSGKTSTLYAAINEIKSKEKNIITIEDPVEYTFDDINQIQVNEQIGLTFASVLRTCLRQDPDIILVGEIRDRETADMAFRSSLTGHLVFSTLHTNGSIAAITRLRDIGVEPFLIASSLLGVLSQRLLRMNCEHCVASYKPENIFIDQFFSFLPMGKKMIFYKGAGCEHCNFTGYKGRTAVFEILKFNPEIRRLISMNKSEEEIRSKARKFGFRSLIEHGIEKVLDGHTTLEELSAVIGQRDQGNKEECQGKLVSNQEDRADLVFVRNILKSDLQL